jgi:subtilase family serine protease
MVLTHDEATPNAHTTDVVHPARHPDFTLIGPAQIRHFYNLDSVKNRGEGQTIALIGAWHDPNLDHDLAVFSQRFGLPQCTLANKCLRQIDTPGTNPADWKPKPGEGKGEDKPHSYGEEEMDVEWAHALAPAAHLILVGGPTGGWSHTLAEVEDAVANGATVVSLSLAEPQRADHKQMYLDGNKRLLDTRASYVASAGDHAHTARWPASSPDVVGVGGTTITTNDLGERIKEIAWTKHSSEPHATGTGGGLSLAEPEPGFQITYGIPGDDSLMRGTPDVSMYSTSHTGIAVYNSNVSPKSGEAPLWHYGGGTSAGAPMWAGLIAVANSMRVAKGKSILSKYVGKDGNKGTLAALYTVAKSTPDAFFDITEGTNGDCGAECTAGPGYDYLTGLGSPNGAVLLNALASLP